MGITDTALFQWASLLGVPVVAYSIFYQASVVRKWCPLCMGVVCVLLLQFGFLWMGGISVPPISFGLIPLLIWTFTGLLMITIWWQLKDLLRDQKAYRELRLNHHKFKRNFSLFQAAHQQGEPLSQTHYIPGEIVLGPDTAPIELMVVTSPYCHYCKQAHNDLERLLDAATGQVKLIVRFRVNFDDKDNLYKIVSQLLHRYHNQGAAAVLRALQELYQEHANPDTWLEQNDLRFNPGYDRVMQLQSQWCEENQISFTPALYLNGRQYPSAYDRTDLLLFIDQLIETAAATETERVAS